jgi:threonine/homoserine/homoserine lactone efflux protein
MTRNPTDDRHRARYGDAVIDLDRVGGFALAAFIIIVVPGPSVLFVVSRGIALGRRAALATVLGNTLGAGVAAFLVSAGLGPIIAGSAAVFTVLKFVGAAYLIYLGIQAFRHRRSLSAALSDQVAEKSTRTIVREGFVVGITNPKIFVFFAAVLPQFVDRSGSPAPVQMLILASVFLAIGMLSDGAWGVLAGTVRQWVVRSPKRLETVGGIGGLAIVGLGVNLALTGRRN